MSTGEDWHEIMYDYSDDEPWARLYFISFVSITSFVMLNLFIMVILQQYEEYHNNPESAVQMFKRHIR
jgi:hypothetical protein